MSPAEQILSSSIFSKWHWFQYHFRGLPDGTHTPFSFDFLNRCSLIEHKITGFTEEIINRMAAISGKERYEPHYEQLLQLLVEVVIFYRLAEHFLAEPVDFEWEPITGTSKKNPELKLSHPLWVALVEIKCPSMFNHLREAAKHDVQLSTRIGDPAIFDGLSQSGHAIRPLDNKIKDYLMSSEGKFSEFRGNIPKPVTFLYIAWTQYLFEAISALSNEMSGLFTPRSFLRNSDNKPVEFESVDAVIVSEHLELVIRSTREEGLPHGYSSPLDYGAFLMEGFQKPVLIQNPSTPDTAEHPVAQALGAAPVNATDDPRAKPLDYVMWIK